MPSEVSDITRVISLNMLGVTINHNLSMLEHVNSLVSACGQNLYALKVLKAHGLSGESLCDVCHATLVAKLTYASPAWQGYATSLELARLQAVLGKAQRWGVYSSSAPDLDTIINSADRTLFSNILGNSQHVLHNQLPAVKTLTHNLRVRPHDRVLPTKTAASERNFLARMLFQNIF